MKKFKLFMSIATMCLALAVLCFGVFSATQVSYNIGGSISYEVNDVFVKITTNVYKVAGNDPKSKTEMESDISELKTKELSSIDTTKYIPSQVDLGVYDSSKEISETNINSATGINIVYGKDTQGTAYYTYYIVINVENLSTRTDVCAHIEDKTTSDTNSIKATNTYINNITSANETKNIVIGYSLKDKTTSIDSIKFNYTLTASFEAYEEISEPYNYKFALNDDKKTATLESFTGLDKNIEIPTYVGFENSVLGYRSFGSADTISSCFLAEFYGQPRMTDVFNVTYKNPATGKRIKDLLDFESISKSIRSADIYPVEIDLGSYTIENMEQYTKFSSKCFTSIPTSISNGTAIYVTFGENGNKVVRTKYTSDNKSQLDTYLEALKNDNSYFPVKVEFETLNYCEASNGNSYSVTVIAESAFDCIDIESHCLEVITLPKQLKEIGITAFKSCSKLTTVNIPGTLTKIGKDAFSYSNKLTTINYDGTQAQWNAITRDVSDGINVGVKVVCTDGTITIS